MIIIFHIQIWFALNYYCDKDLSDHAGTKRKLRGDGVLAKVMFFLFLIFIMKNNMGMASCQRGEVNDGVIL